MKAIRSSFWLCGAVLIGLLCHIAAAQTNSAKRPPSSESDSKKITRVELASNFGPPGTVVVLPIYFSPEQGVEVGSVRLLVTFPSANLKFEKLERGATARNVGLTSEVHFGKNDQGVSTATLTVIATVASSEPSAKGISAGMLGTLTMRISDTARHGVIALRTAAEAMDLETNKPLQNVRAAGARVEVAWVDAPPSVTCFFFSH